MPVLWRRGDKIPLQAWNRTFSLLRICSLLPSQGPGWRLAKENIKDSILKNEPSLFLSKPHSQCGKLGPWQSCHWSHHLTSSITNHWGHRGTVGAWESIPWAPGGSWSKPFSLTPGCTYWAWGQWSINQPKPPWKAIPHPVPHFLLECVSPCGSSDLHAVSLKWEGKPLLWGLLDGEWFINKNLETI